MDLRDYVLNIRCGLHSGISPCCIAWFVGPWHRLLRACWKVDSQPKHPWAHGLHARYLQALKERGFDHVGCPVCLLRVRPVVLKDCNCGPEDWLVHLLVGDISVNRRSGRFTGVES